MEHKYTGMDGVAHSKVSFLCSLYLSCNNLNNLNTVLPLNPASGGVSAPASGVGVGAGEERTTTVQMLPSPYSKITAPRKPHRCSSGHASDNR